MAKVKGICRNYDNCDKAAEKEIQEVEKTNFVCEECGKPLYSIEEKKSQKRDLRLPILIAVVLIVIGGIVCGVIMGIKAKNKHIAEIAESQRLQTIQDSIQADSIAAVQFAIEQAALEQVRLDSIAAAEQARLAEVEANAAKKSASSTSGSLDYGKWSGAWKAGKPHGTGTMKYTKQHLIDSRDPQKRTASPGDYIIGEFANGKLVQGVWYDSSNNVKGSIIIGM